MKVILIRILEKLGILRFFNFNLRININHRYCIIPLRGRIGLENVLLREHWFTNFLDEILNDKGEGANNYFVDIGVNVGQTLLKVKSLCPELNYIGFEPNSTCVSYVLDLVKANSFSNVIIYPLGLSERDGMLKLFADNAHASGASVIENFRKKTRVEYVMNIPVAKGDNLFNDFEGVIKLIKIDVEGFEADVLTGLKSTLDKFKPIVICEVLPVYSNDNKSRMERQNKLEELLRIHEYDIYRINEDSAKISPIPEIGIHGDMTRTNYIFCHRSKKALLSALIE
jgi:FkbM family methyltransferase